MVNLKYLESIYAGNQIDDTILRQEKVTALSGKTNTTIKKCGYRPYNNFSDSEKLLADPIIAELKRFLPMRNTNCLFICNDKTTQKAHLNGKISKRKEAGVLKGSMRSVGKLLFVVRLQGKRSIVKTKFILDCMEDLNLHIHHKNHNVWDNSTENLQLLTITQHNDLHNGKITLKQAETYHQKNLKNLLGEIQKGLY